MNNECEKRGGCRNEKNSVNLGHSTNEGSATMPVKKENRDHAKEYARRKAKGEPAKTKLVGAHVALDKLAIFEDNMKERNDNKNALINKWIDMYNAGELN